MTCSASSRDIVIVSLGTNDAGRSDPEGFEKGYRELLKSILSRGSTVITRTPNPIISMTDGTEMREWVTSGNPPVTYMVEEYSALIVKISKELDCLCVDHYGRWKKSLASKYHGEMSMLMGNSMHPNAVGHRRFYFELAPVFGLGRVSFQNDFEHILRMEGRNMSWETNPADKGTARVAGRRGRGDHPPGHAGVREHVLLPRQVGLHP